MDIPVYYQNQREGVLHIYREGLYTVFEARLPPHPELTRLWVEGGGQSACLGLMEPRPEGLWLRRRFSRAQRAGLPARPERAWAGPGRSRPRRQDPAQGEKKPAGPAPSHEPDTGQPQWLPRPDGSRVDPRRRLLALPCALEAERPGLRKICLDGRDYLVFRY